MRTRSSNIISLFFVLFFLIFAFISIKVSAAPLVQEEPSLVDQIWVRLGIPIGGLGYDIRMRPDNPDVMYVTDAWTGVNKSVDGGYTWFPINEGIDVHSGFSGDAIPVFCLTIDPNNNDLIWIGMQDFGTIYYSRDGGQSWEKRINGIVENEGLTIRGITVEPGNSNVVYVAGEIGSWIWANQEMHGREFDRVRGVVYKTTDGGENWHAIWRGDNLARYILIDSTDHNILYISTGIFDREAANSDPDKNIAGGEGVLKSTDGGETWHNINHGLNNLYVGSLAMHPQDPKILLAGIGNNAYPENGGFYLSTDGGDTWRHAIGERISSVEFAPSDPDIAYAAGDSEFYRSENAGRTWTSVVKNDDRGWGPEAIRPGQPIDMQVDPRDPNRIFVNNYGGGNFLSSDGGKTWKIASKGYSGADITEVFVYPDNPAFVLMNGRSGPFMSHDGGAHVQGINPVDIRAIAEGARIAVDPENPLHILSSSAHWGWMFESNDGGMSWQLVTNYENRLQNLPTNTNDRFQGFQAISFSPSDPKIVYGGFGIWSCTTTEADNCNPETIFSLFLSRSGGRSWTALKGTPLDGLTVSEIVVHPTNSNIAWAATVKGGVFITKDLGKTWGPLNNGLASNEILDLTIDPSNPNILYAGTFDKGVFKTEDGGNSWIAANVGLDPNENIHSIVINPTNPEMLFAGSLLSGVFISEDGGEYWHLFNQGLTTRSVASLSISGDGETLYAGTKGGGVFRLSTHNQTYFDSFVATPTPTSSPTPAPTATTTSSPTPTSTSTFTPTPTVATTPTPTSTQIASIPTKKTIIAPARVLPTISSTPIITKNKVATVTIMPNTSTTPKRTNSPILFSYLGVAILFLLGLLIFAKRKHK